MPNLFRSIRTRMIAVFVLLLVLVMGKVLYFVYQASLQNAQTQVEAEFNTASKTFAQLMRQREAFLRQGVEVLADDFAFKQALRMADLATVESALVSQASRFKADTAMLVSLDGNFLVNTKFPDSFGEPFPCMRMISVAQEFGGSAGYVRIEDQAYQVVLTPVLAPEPIAWLVLAYVVNDDTTRNFSGLSGVGVSLMSVGDAGAHVLASSLAGPKRTQTLQWLNAFEGFDYHMRRVQLGDQEEWIHLVKLDSASALDYVAALTLSLDEAMAPYLRLRTTLLEIAGVAMLLFLLGAWWLASRLTRPVNQLVEGVERVGRGDYAARVAVTSKDELGVLAQGFNEMAAEIDARQQQVTYLAYHDALTGMPNRTAFAQELNGELATGAAKPGVMLVACLARLRLINVGLGFAVADGLIKAVAQRIQTRSDWRVASLGGEKFAFYCQLDEQKNRDDWEVQVRSVLEIPLEWAGQRYDLGMHLGSALFPQDGEDAEILLRRAEQAMQRGNHTVGAHVAYQPEFDTNGARRLSLLNDLRAGIEGSQLLACFQPKARLSDGRIVAVELLIRWQHPVQGMVYPDDFIPAAEQSTLIRPLTNWVIDRAASQAALWRDRWQGSGREIAVGINLSARNLADHEVVEQLANALARHGLPSSALIAEITESAFMDDAETAISVVNAIAALGLKVSIDDFGAGYSSLSLLSRLPVKELKIDKAFVMRMLESPQEDAIVKSTIELAHTLGMMVVAEGVESHAHWQRLQAYGCDVAQGYYLSKPIELAAFEAWLIEREGSEYEG
jgi:diguanylate cyclase (GGDEF)-like protein